MLDALPPAPPVADDAADLLLWRRWQRDLTRPVGLRERVPPLRMLLVSDNLAGRLSVDLVLWLFGHGVTPLYTPLGGSWLNMAESFQRILKRRALDGRHPASPAAVIGLLEGTAAGWNRHPTPFVWGGPAGRPPAAGAAEAGGDGRVRCPRHPPPARRTTPAGHWQRPCHMTHECSLVQTWNRIKLATAAAAAAAVAVAGGVLLAHDHPAPPSAGGGVPPAAATASKGELSGEARTIQTPSLAVVVSADGKTLTGYSKHLNKWAAIDAGPVPFDPKKLAVAGDVAVYPTDDTVWAFSGLAGTWDSAKVARAADHPPMTGPAAAYGAAAFSVPGETRAYSPITGKWSDALDTAGDAAATRVVSPTEVTAQANGKVYFFSLSARTWTPGF